MSDALGLLQNGSNESNINGLKVRYYSESVAFEKGSWSWTHSVPTGIVIIFVEICVPKTSGSATGMSAVTPTTPSCSIHFEYKTSGRITYDASANTITLSGSGGTTVSTLRPINIISIYQ